MDTTTIQTALSLLQGNSDILTPMTLLDLANVVSALIVNDNVFHLASSHLDSTSFNELLGNEPIFIPIPVNQNCPPAVGSLTIGHWKQSRVYLTTLAHPESRYPEDARAIRSAWETILGPGSDWKNWHEETIEFVNRHYGEESDPPRFLAEATDLFRAGTFADRKPMISRGRVGDFVGECNLRSLFDWSIAYAFKLPYVPNSFRLPFQQFLYAKGDATRQYLIRFLDNETLKKAREVQSIEHHLRVPQFLSAILGRASSLQEVVQLLQGYRLDAVALRKRKAEVDGAIRREDYKAIKKLMQSMELEEKPRLWQYAAGAVGVVALGYIGAAVQELHPASIHALEVAGEILATAGIAKVGEEAAVGYLYKPRFRFINKAVDFASETLDMRDKVSELWKTRIGNDFSATAQRLRDLSY